MASRSQPRPSAWDTDWPRGAAEANAEKLNDDRMLAGGVRYKPLRVRIGIRRFNANPVMSQYSAELASCTRPRENARVPRTRGRSHRLPRRVRSGVSARPW